MLNPNTRMPKFSYIKPESIRQASEFLELNSGQSYPFLGGTDLLIALRDKKLKPKYLVDLKHLDHLNVLTFDSAKSLIIGAAVTLNRLIESEDVQKYYPVLVQGAREVGSYQLRTRATLIGNLCNASPCGDMIATSMVYKGIVNIIGTYGSKSVELESFFTGPGETILKPGEIVVSLSLPISPSRAKGIYLSIGRNKLADLAIAAVTVLAYPDETAFSGFRFLIALSAVAPTVIFVEEAQSLLSDKPIEIATLKKAALIAKNHCKPIDDIRASKKYRQEMIHSLTLRALIAVWEDLQKN